MAGSANIEMRPASSAILSLLASSALAFALRCWPRAERAGWFELDGHPRTIDRVPVGDWQQVNEVLARQAMNACAALHESHRAKGSEAVQVWVVDIPLEYEPAQRAGEVERLIVRQRVPARVLWADRHPVAYCTYEVVGADETTRRP